MNWFRSAQQDQAALESYGEPDELQYIYMYDGEDEPTDELEVISI